MTQARVLLRIGIERAVGRCDEGARRVNISKSLMSRMLAGERNIAPDLGRKLSQMHPLNAMAIAAEMTGYNCFRFDDSDRHPLALLHRLLKEDREADRVVDAIAERILGKSSRDDLNDDDVAFLLSVAKEISDRMAADFNILAGIEDRYRVGVWSVLVQTEKAPATVARAKERPLKTAAR